MYFSAGAEGRISYGHLGRTNLFLIVQCPCNSLTMTASLKSCTFIHSFIHSKFYVKVQYSSNFLSAAVSTANPVLVSALSKSASYATTVTSRAVEVGFKT